MPKPVGILLVMAFVLVDVALGAAAWIHVHREPSGSDIDPALSAVAGSARTPTQRLQLESANVVMVAAGTDGAVIMARRGDCAGEPAVVRVSLNGGRTLSDVGPGVGEVLAVRVADNEQGTLTVIGADANCNLVARQSTDGGRAWKDGPAASLDSWYAAAGNLEEVIGPDGPSEPGCTVSSLSPIDENFARISCTDGRIRGTGDAGKTWTTLGKLANVRAASFDDYTNGSALARHEGCAAYAFTTSDGGRTWEPQGCAGGDQAQALTSDGTRLVAVVDRQVAVSANRGATWTIHELATPSPAR